MLAAIKTGHYPYSPTALLDRLRPLCCLRKTTEMSTRRRVTSIRSGGAKIKVPAPVGNRFWVVKTVASHSTERTVLNGSCAVKEISIPNSGRPNHGSCEH